MINFFLLLFTWLLPLVQSATVGKYSFATNVGDGTNSFVPAANVGNENNSATAKILRHLGKD